MSSPDVSQNSHQVVERRKHLLRFAYLCTLIVWSVLAFAQFVEYFHEGELFATVREGHPYIIDFPLYYAAGQMAQMAMHAPTNIYDIQLQDKTLKALIAPVAPDPPWFIQCPPPVFFVAAALPFVSLPAAWTICCLIGDLFFFAALYLLLKNELGNKRNFLYIAVAVCGSFPFWLCNRMGQLALITVPSAILFFHLLRQKKSFAAGLLTALISFKFQYLPVLGLVGLAVGRWRFLAGALTACALTIALSGLTLGWQNVLTYPQTVMHAEYATKLYSGVNPRDQQNIRALIVRTMGGESEITNKLCIALCLVVAVVLCLLWLRNRDEKATEQNEHQLDTGTVADAQETSQTHKNLCATTTAKDSRFKFLASTTICCMLLFSPHAHTQDYLILVVPAAWIWLASLEKSSPASGWPRKFVIFLPFLSWPLFIIDGLNPLPSFALLIPILVAASYTSFVTKIE